MSRSVYRPLAYIIVLKDVNKRSSGITITGLLYTYTIAYNPALSEHQGLLNDSLFAQTGPIVGSDVDKACH